MEKILLVDSSFPINVRNQKILKSLKSASFADVRYCTWHRDEKEIPANERENFIFSRKSVYGNRIRKVLNLWGYYRFIKQTINRFKPSVIIASHWDMLVLVSLLKPSKGCVLIYENLDMPTSYNGMVRWLFQRIEKWALKRTNKVIFASRFFEPQYGYFNRPKLVLENKPYRIEFFNEKKIDIKRPFTITFLGTVRYFEIVKNLIDAATGLDVEVQIWGDGPDEKKLRNYSREIPNVKFFGRFDYRIINTIYAGSDLIWAVYPNDDFNVKYAISNKYFESLLFRKPGVFAQNTFLGEMVENNNIGFTVNPYDTHSIQYLFKQLSDNPAMQERCIQNINLNTETKYWEDEEHKLISFITS